MIVVYKLVNRTINTRTVRNCYANRMVAIIKKEVDDSILQDKQPGLVLVDYRGKMAEKVWNMNAKVTSDNPIVGGNRTTRTYINFS